MHPSATSSPESPAMDGEALKAYSENTQQRSRPVWHYCRLPYLTHLEEPKEGSRHNLEGTAYKYESS